MSDTLSPSPPSNALVEHISAQSGSLPSARRLRPYFWNSAFEWSSSGPPAQKVHLSILPRLPKRSEEHTSELQSLMRISYAVFCLKKKTKTRHILRKQVHT